MAHAVELLFDPETEDALRAVWRDVRDATGSTLLFDLEARPHLSLAVYERAGGGALADAVRGFGAAPLDLALASAGAFPGDEGALFLAPVVTPELLALHRRWHARAPGSHPYYAPGRWVPHATVGILLGEAALVAGFAVARAAPPIAGRIQGIALVEFERLSAARPVVTLVERRLAGS